MDPPIRIEPLRLRECLLATLQVRKNLVSVSVLCAQATVLMALLQPPPEVYDLFDDILLLCEGAYPIFLRFPTNCSYSSLTSTEQRSAGLCSAGWKQHMKQRMLMLQMHGVIYRKILAFEAKQKGEARCSQRV